MQGQSADLSGYNLSGARGCSFGLRAQDLHRAFEQGLEFAGFNAHSVAILLLWLVRTGCAALCGGHGTFFDVHGWETPLSPYNKE